MHIQLRLLCFRQERGEDGRREKVLQGLCLHLEGQKRTFVALICCKLGWEMGHLFIGSTVKREETWKGVGDPC
jgi:hypothetical protein